MPLLRSSEASRRLTQEVEGEHGLFAFPTDHAQNPTQCQVVYIMPRHLLIRACIIETQSNRTRNTNEAHAPSLLNPVIRATINPGFEAIRSFGSNPNLSKTPGRKGSIKTSARQSDDLSGMGAESIFLSTAKPSGVLRFSEIDLLPL